MRAALCCLLLLPSVAAIAQVPSYDTLELQARTNLIVNGPSFNLPDGSSFNSVTVSLDELAQVAFKVQILPGTNAAGVWFGGGGVGSIRCQSEDVVDVFITDVHLDGAGGIVFGQTGGNINGLYRCDPSVPAASLLTAQPLGTTSWGTPRGASDSSVGYRASFGSGRAWVSFAAGQARIHAAEETIQPGSGVGFLFTPAYGESGRIAGKVQVLAAGPVPQHDEIQLIDSQGAVTTLATQVAVDPNSPFTGFDNSVALGPDDQVAFIANRVGGGRGVFRVRAGQAAEPLALTGVDGLVEIEFFGPAINADGLVAFRGRDAAGQAVFVADGSSLGKVISQGDQVPSDLGTAQIGQNDASTVFGGGVAINGAGDVAFIAALHPPGNNQIEWGSGVYVAYATVTAIFADGFE
ncbi:MAG: hypothetical protein R3F15_12080 [Lysobacterales bacterium]